LAIRECAGVFHQASGVADGELNIVDDFVVRVAGIQFAREVAAQDFVLTGFSEDLAGRQAPCVLRRS
jgi:hypothetical protein